MRLAHLVDAVVREPALEHHVLLALRCHRLVCRQDGPAVECLRQRHDVHVAPSNALAADVLRSSPGRLARQEGACHLRSVDDASQLKYGLAEHRRLVGGRPDRRLRASLRVDGHESAESLDEAPAGAARVVLARGQGERTEERIEQALGVRREELLSRRQSPEVSP